MTEDQHPSVKQLALLAIPGLVIGVLSGLLLAGISGASHWLEHVIWETVPHGLGVDGDASLWIILALTATGLAVGLTVWLMPGHAGDDPATSHMVSKPPALIALPGIALAVILALAGGVSLGPENPTIAIAVGLAVWLGARFAPHVPGETLVLIAAAGVIGALFGSPVAAALLLTEMVASLKRGGMLWDRLFAPIVAAAAGGITTALVGGALPLPKLPEYTLSNPVDLLTGSAIALAAALLGLAAAVVLPVAHRLLHSLRHPVLYLGIGGLLLGLLGALGGPITLFKGADQSVELVDNADTYTAGGLTLILLVKIAALIISSAASFRGGRIFPALFIGIAAGLLANALFPAVPLTLAVSAAVLGFVLAVARDGWLAIFIAAVIAGGGSILGPLCIIVLPVWLLVARAPEMIVRAKQPDAAAAPAEA